MKRQVYNSCVLSTTTYGAKTWVRRENMGTHQPSKDEKKYVKYHIPG